MKAKYSYRVYARELKQGFETPCFFIELINSHGSRLMDISHNRKQFFCIHYFAKGFDELPYFEEEDFNEKELQAFEMNVYQVAEELYQILEVIRLEAPNNGSSYLRGIERSYTISGGVLHFTLSYSYHLVEVLDHEYMQELDHRTKTRGGA